LGYNEGEGRKEHNMSYIKLIDLLKKGEKFHRDLAAYYEDLEHEASNPQVKCMLEHMRLHEEILANSIHAYEMEAPSGTIDMWFQYEPETNLAKMIAEADVSPDMGPDEVIEMAVKFDNAMVMLYRQLREMSPPTQVREAFDKLLEMEEEQRKRLVRGLQGGM